MSVRGFNTGSGIEQYDYDYLDNKPDAPTKESIGLGNVDNTSDMEKPVSTLQEQALSQKVDKVPGMGLSSEDYTSAEKEKLGNLPTNAELEVALEEKANQTEVTSLNQAINVLDGQVNDSTTGLDTKAPAIINTASGAIASFADGADSMPVKKLVVNVEPVQDLHGYDNPWPAGGGVNLLPPQEITGGMSNVQVSSNGDKTTINGTASAYGQVVSANTFTLDAGTYFLKVFVVSGSVTDGSVKYQLRSVNGVTVYADAREGLEFTLQERTELKPRVTYTTGSVISNYIIQAMVVSGSTAPTTFAPYSNICPISGWTGAEIEGTGKNLIPNLKVQDTSTRVRLGESTVGNGFFLKAGTYKISFALVTAQTVGVYWRTYKDGVSGAVVNSDTVTIDEDCFIRVWLYASGGISADNVAWFQLELGSTASDYDPFQSQEISVTFPSSAGTVYGATLTINPDRTGQLVVDRAITSKTWAEFTNKLSSENYKEGRITNLPVDLNRRPETICNRLVYSTSADITPNMFYISGTSYIRAFVPLDTADTDEFTFVYPLASPITYTLTASEIDGILETLYGTNNIWADCGDVDVTYAADTKLYIEHLTQPTEDDMTADHAISAGTFFMIGNTLYLATSQIAAGATITPGTNATQLSLADALNQLNT